MFKILLIILLFYAAATLYLYLKQRDLMYFPTAEDNRELADVWWYQHADQRLKIWSLPPLVKDSESAIIYFGGNAEAVENNIRSYRQWFGQHAVFISNYRGFGGSSGSPNEQDLLQDALSIYDQVRQQYRTIHVIGRSLGSGIAMHVAANREVDRLALITPYDSILNVAQSAYPMFPVKWLLKDHYDSISLSPGVSSNVLVLIVNGDRVVPNSGSDRLIESLANNPLKVVRIDEATHGDVENSSVYQQALINFLSPMTPD